MNVSPDLDARFRAAALAEGLVDVRFDLVDSPVGELFVAATERGVCRISYSARRPGGRARPPLRACACYARRSTRCAASSTSTSPALGAASGSRSTCASRPSTRPCWPSSRASPTVSSATYGALAARVGRPRAARAVGGVMNRNPIPIVLPCHRIIGADGSLTGYAGGLEIKRALLELEGVLLGR